MKNDQIRKDPSHIANAALQAFFNLTKIWGLSSTEERTLLGAPQESTFFKWKATKSAHRLSKDTLDRISYLLGIYKDLNILLPSAQSANEWIRKPNQAPQFNGQSALDRMMSGCVIDLADIRRYLDTQR